MDMRALLLALAAILLSGPVLADPFPTGVPETVGLSSERLQHLSTILQNEVDRHRIPGAVIAVARKGQLAYYEALGFRNPEAKIPMPRDAIFSIASMTKPMVSVAIMMLHDEGKLFLSDPVSKYLPALANMQVATIKTDSADGKRMETVPAKRQPTFRICYGTLPAYLWQQQDHGGTQVVAGLVVGLTYTAPEFIELLSKAPLLDQTGTVWDYGVSVDALGLVVEAMTGKSFGEFMQERLWRPLGIVDTSFNIPSAKRPRYALTFRNDPFTENPQSALIIKRRHFRV